MKDSVIHEPVDAVLRVARAELQLRAGKVRIDDRLPLIAGVTRSRGCETE